MGRSENIADICSVVEMNSWGTTLFTPHYTVKDFGIRKADCKATSQDYIS
jgi:hypothetical protein